MNMMMFRYLLAIRDDKDHGFDPLEVGIARATAIKNKWLSKDGTLTWAGKDALDRVMFQGDYA